jgi:hypothetical protein
MDAADLLVPDAELTDIQRVAVSVRCLNVESFFSLPKPLANQIHDLALNGQFNLCPILLSLSQRLEAEHRKRSPDCAQIAETWREHICHLPAVARCSLLGILDGETTTTPGR